MGKSNGLLIAGGIAAAIFILPSLLNKSQESGGLNYFGASEGGGGFDLAGLNDIFGSFGDMLGGVTGAFADTIKDVTGNGTDTSNIFKDLFAGLGGGNGDGNGDGTGTVTGTPDIITAIKDLIGGAGGAGLPGLNGVNGSNGVTTTIGNGLANIVNPIVNPFTDLLNSGANLFAEGGKAALTIGGVYVGGKLIAPAIPGIANIIKTGVSGAGRVISGAGNIATKIPGALANSSRLFGVQGALGWGNVLRAPLSSLPALPTIGLAALSGAAGYGVGTLLMNYTPLGEITGKWAEGAGSWFANTSLGEKIWPRADINLPVVNAALNKAGGASWDATRVQNLARQGYQPSQILALMRSNGPVNNVKTGVLNVQNTAALGVNKILSLRINAASVSNAQNIQKVISQVRKTTSITYVKNPGTFTPTNIPMLLDYQRSQTH